jgi:hypothetical protein
MKVMVFILSLVLFVGGLGLMGYSFGVNDIGQTQFNIVMFVGGLLASSIAVFIPMHVLNWVDRA